MATTTATATLDGLRLECEGSGMKQPWERVFDKNFVAGTLTRAGLYLLAYELLRESIVGRIKSFLCWEIKDGKEVLSPKYIQMLSQHKNDLVASCMWLEQNRVLSAEDVRSVLNIRAFRNDIAHELPAILVDGKRDINTEHVVQICQLLAKVDRWWIINVELATDEEYAGQEVEENEVKSGTMVLMEHLLTTLHPEGHAPAASA